MAMTKNKEYPLQRFKVNKFMIYFLWKIQEFLTKNEQNCDLVNNSRYTASNNVLLYTRNASQPINTSSQSDGKQFQWLMSL